MQESQSTLEILVQESNSLDNFLESREVKAF